MKKKTEKKEEAVEAVEVEFAVGNKSFPVILPITQDFGSGELNVLRDKLNEIITKIF